MAIKIQIRRDTTANWTLKNPVLAQGELGLDLTTKQFKIGDGVTNWATLTFFSSGGGSGGSVTGAVDGGASTDSDNYTSPTTATGGVDSEWVLRQTPKVQADSDWIIRTIKRLDVDSDWILRQIPKVQADSDWILRQIPSGSTGGGVDSEWVLANTGLQTRKTVTVTTDSLANNAAANVNITNAGKSYYLLKIQTDKAAWVRFYVSDATRTADESREQSTDPAPDAGVIAEIVTSGAQTVLISPSTIGFNNESTPTLTIPCRVTNLSGSTGTVTVTATIVRIE
jgi:hypothetical protein